MFIFGKRTYTHTHTHTHTHIHTYTPTHRHTHTCTYIHTDTQKTTKNTNIKHLWDCNFVVLVSVCSAGYYRDGSRCLLCPENNIKTLAGNEPHCDADPLCDGITTVPNENHTACGSLNLHLSSHLFVNICCESI